MSGTISVREAANRWNLAVRTVAAQCEKGRIPGAVKTGKQWLIPSDARKPIDLRYKGNAPAVRTDRPLLPFPVGISDYRLASTEYYYIDKTLMIRDFLDRRPMVSLFTRPRRFGKTLNMDMLRTFFERTDQDTSVYFVNKKIWSCGEKYRSYQGKYPVIFLSFKDVKKHTWDETFEQIVSLITGEYRRHAELAGSEKTVDSDYYRRVISGDINRSMFEDSLFMLTKMLHEHYDTPPVVIIDEYDTPIQQGYSKGFYDEVIAFTRNLLSACLKDNRHLAYGFLTGILRVAKESIFSGLNNLSINSVLDNGYSEYFGFTVDEVKEIAAYYGCPEKYEEICEWYDGYRFGKTDIFNPWSVVNYFSNGCEPRAFWLSTGSNDIIGEMISEANDEITQRLTALVNGASFVTNIDTSVIYPQIRNDPSTIYSFLLVAGYLKVLRSSVSIDGDFICEVALPNKEIALVYRKEILQRMEHMISRPLVIAIQEALFSGDANQLKNVIRSILLQSVSSFDTEKENFYHGFMLGICALLGDSYITSNRESGEGRYDLQLRPRRAGLPGILIELKAGRKRTDEELLALARTALAQIESKQYDTEMIANGVQTIYRYGVAFSGKKVEIVVK